VNSLLVRIDKDSRPEDIETTIKQKETFDIRDREQTPRQSPGMQRPSAFGEQAE
jgi:hypothetical protein